MGIMGVMVIQLSITSQEVNSDRGLPSPDSRLSLAEQEEYVDVLFPKHSSTSLLRGQTLYTCRTGRRNFKTKGWKVPIQDWLNWFLCNDVLPEKGKNAVLSLNPKPSKPGCAQS